MITTAEILLRAKAACASLGTAGTDGKNRALRAMADALEQASAPILQANALDLAAAKGKVPDTMLDRLALSEARIGGMAEGIRQVAALPDPVGRVRRSTHLKNGLQIEQISVPMGVVGIIYESRPNVTSDAAALCFKSGNVCVLRVGKEAYRSAAAIVQALQAGLAQAGFDPYAVNLIEDTSRESANEMMRAEGLIDLLIPRGGAGLIRACVENARVPCIQTGTGICHIYVDASADLDMALEIVNNAKTSRPSVCNAEEVCLVHREIAPAFLPGLKKRLADDRVAQGLTPVEFRVDAAAAQYLDGTPASERDFDTEFLDYILAVAVVEDVTQAVKHIAAHSTHHSDGIVAGDPSAVQTFINGVDSAAVYVNASTRFTDGGEFGLGCEMGISTQKLHARGPMGLEELTTYRYIVTGNGQIR